MLLLWMLPYGCIRENTETEFPPDDERKILVELYNNTEGVQWKHNDGWDTDAPLKDWYGLNVDHQGYVTGLYLSSNGLTGEIPGSLRGLEHLRALHLEGNSLTGSIPESLGDLKSIEYIYLGDNNLTGHLPESFGNLHKLKYLDLSCNSLTGNIPESYAGLNPQGMEMFNLTYNCLTGDVPESITAMEGWPFIWMKILKGNTLSAPIPDVPEFSVRTTNGETITKRDLQQANKITCIYGWSYLTAWMDETMNTMKDLYGEYRDKGLDVIGYTINLDTRDRPWTDVYDIPWKTWYQNDNRKAFLGRTFGDISGTVIAFDSEGHTVFNNITQPFDYLKTVLQRELGEKDRDAYVSSNFSADGTIHILREATRGRGIDVVLFGDGFSDRQIADGTYADAMMMAGEAFLDEEPFRTYADCFNIRYVDVVSASEGYVSGGDTALRGAFSDGSTHVEGDNAACMRYARLAVQDEGRLEETLIAVIMNSNKYAGTTYLYCNSIGGGGGRAIAYVPLAQDTGMFSRIFKHEVCGHGFAKLSDEYGYWYKGTIPEIQVEKNRALEKFGWWTNIDYSCDSTAVKWSRYINRLGYEGTGCFEGGDTYYKGVWRPTENSIMRDNTDGFNAPSREAIYRRIHRLAFGERWTFDEDKFFEYDKKNTGKPKTKSVETNTDDRPLSEPIIIYQ